MAKPAKSIPAASEDAAKPKSKKLMVIIIAALGLLIASGAAAWYFTKSSSHTEAAKPHPALAPKFIALEPFTVNLQGEEAEKSLQVFLQIGITLKIVDPELEERIKTSLPEIRSRLLFLLSSKHASELSTVEGKLQLAKEIKAEVEVVLGLRTAPVSVPTPITHEGNAASGAEAASHAVSVPAESAQKTAHGGESDAGIVDVLFTSFIIQ